MKVKTNLAQPQITKILKALETRQLVKTVKNVNNPSRKIYMLHELQPDQELTGGAWWVPGWQCSSRQEVLAQMAQCCGMCPTQSTAAEYVLLDLIVPNTRVVTDARSTVEGPVS